MFKVTLLVAKHPSLLPLAQNLFHHIETLGLTLFLSDFMLFVFLPVPLPDVVFLLQCSS